MSSFAYPSSAGPEDLRLLIPLDISRAALRFFLVKVPRAGAPAYTAVSYTWGNDEASEVIYIDNQKFHVRPNLWSCLYYIGQDALRLGTRLWVDAICIDQSSAAERNAQVRRMDETYRQAAHVSVWLGLPSIPDHIFVPKHLLPVRTLEVDPFDWFDHLKDLANRPYWSRLWVIQEYLLGQDVLLYCGNTRMLGFDFQMLLCRQAGVFEFDESFGTPGNAANDGAIAKFPALSLVMGRHVDKYPAMRRPLHELLVANHRAECKDTRDKVFGLLGLVTVDERRLLEWFFPDYNLSEDHVRIIALAHVLQCHVPGDSVVVDRNSDELFLGLGVRSVRERRRLLRRARMEEFDYVGCADIGEALRSLEMSDEYERIRPFRDEEEGEAHAGLAPPRATRLGLVLGESMDPLSITASVAGLLTAAAKAQGLLEAISSVQNAPTTIREAQRETRHTEIALRSLHRFLQRLDPMSERLEMIQVDELRVVLADAMLLFSSFESMLELLARMGRLRMSISWTRYTKQLDEHLGKLERYKSSLTFMLSILQCATNSEARVNQAKLQSQVEQVLADNAELREKLKISQDWFDARSMARRHPDDDAETVWLGDDTSMIRGPRVLNTNAARSTADNARSSIIRFAFENILDGSRVYKRTAHIHECDQSFASSAIRSVFTGYSLADISVLSVIAMPLCMVDVSNRRHYVVRNQHSTPRAPDEAEVQFMSPDGIGRSRQSPAMHNDYPEVDTTHVNWEMSLVEETLGALRSLQLSNNSESTQPESSAGRLSPIRDTARNLGEDNQSNQDPPPEPEVSPANAPAACVKTSRITLPSAFDIGVSIVTMAHLPVTLTRVGWRSLAGPTVKSSRKARPTSLAIPLDSTFLVIDVPYAASYSTRTRN
ncbi:heterokaryon incompatibility protein-domain-containing protein [Echria macrotheca]|uniref:Heterokaryon incompatibility protein-domain-containing protein n=1 Tax=Echria macrotheca TaxID=438768 RepID=A0AAJ0F1E8_9PEZI|nr:heterokaryon incompatibility protein-domain-containing protein [Echria macrotheca]